MPNHERPTGGRTRTTPGTVALGDASEPRLADLVDGRTPMPLPVPDEPWSLAGVLCVAQVTDDATHATALDAALRGADVVVDVSTGRVAAFVEDVERLGIALWHPHQTDAALDDWVPLLDALAAGATTEEAARRCHLSLRSAHRRLALARSVLGVSTTAAAVSRWSASETGRG